MSSTSGRPEELAALAEKIKKGGAPKYHQSNAAGGDLPADGVVTGVVRVHGRPVAIMADDSTVKAGSWGERTVEKIIRIQETAGRLRIPLFYLIDSAGARITDQIDVFPGRRHAGR